MCFGSDEDCFVDSITYKEESFVVLADFSMQLLRNGSYNTSQHMTVEESIVLLMLEVGYSKQDQGNEYHDLFQYFHNKSRKILPSTYILCSSKYELVQMDTDSLYFAISKETIEVVVFQVCVSSHLYYIS